MSPSVIPAPRPGVTGAVFDTAERWTGLVIGLAVFVHRHADATHRTVVPTRRSATGPTGADGVLALVPGAVMGIGLAAQRTVFDRVADIEGRVQNLTGRLAESEPVAPMVGRVRGFLARWDERYRSEAEIRCELAGEYLARLGPDALDALLARIDVDALLDHVDVNSAVDRVDLEQLIDKVPVERVIDRVDLRSVVLDTVAQVQVTDILRESTGAMANRLSGGRIRLT